MKDILMYFLAWYGASILMNKLIFSTVMKKRQYNREISDIGVFIISFLGTVVLAVGGYI